MNADNMTLNDFIEFAEIYPYSQDRYILEKMFMELDLIKLHIESYQFLLESDDVTLNQMDVIMVESGINDKSAMTESLFLEKGLGIFSGIQKILSLVGKAITSFFRKIGNLFSGKSKELEELRKRNTEQAKLIENVELFNNVTGAESKVKEAASDANEALSDIKRLSNKVASQLDKAIGGGGSRVLPIAGVDQNNAIRVILSAAVKASNSDIDQASVEFYNTICQDEYEVEGLAIIANLESLISDVSNVIDLTHGDGECDIYYNSAKLLKAMGTQYQQNVNSAVSKIEESVRKNKRFILSSDVIAKKLEAAEKLNETFMRVIKATDIGDVDTARPIRNFGNSFITNDANQKNNSLKAVNDAKGRVKKDDDLSKNTKVFGLVSVRDHIGTSINKMDFLSKFDVYLKCTNEVAVKFQSAISEMIKALTTHMQLRELVVKTHQEITDKIDIIIDSDNKSKKSKK